MTASMQAAARTVLTGAALLAALAWGAAVRAQGTEIEGQKFEPTVQVGGQTLTLNGAGLRKRVVFKVYAAGLYVPAKTGNATNIINDKGPRRMSLRMLRDVDADSFIGALTDGLKANLPETQFTALKPQTDALVATLKSVGEAKKGDVINFDFVPDTGTHVVINGQPRGAAIPGHEFYAAVLRIWIGDKPVDDDLKKGLLGG